MIGPYSLGPNDTPENGIYTGDARELAKEIPDASVDLIITSPPYNCRMDYHSVSDEVPWSIWYEMMEGLLIESLRILRPGGVIALNVPGTIRWQRDHQFRKDWVDYIPNYNGRKGGEVSGRGRIEPVGFRLFNMMEDMGLLLREPIIWVKGPPGLAIASEYRMGCDSDPYMRPCHEWILLASKDRWFHDGGTGRKGPEALPFLSYTKDVWFMKPISGIHPSPFPLELPLRLIRLFIHRNNTRLLPSPVVFDPFMGSGTVAEAAFQEDISWLGFELDYEIASRARDRVEAKQPPLSISES